ncbi:DUF4129 domain-containing protein [Neobacillus sp. OS1-33]|jgi:hypothetical protein|uniref:DUF4129 domain-containing protein n=1 Tax=Neobacillus sp. OS1-33 TaxID=3070683 RepID=UPI0027E11C9D|nr:DUF4129 domain-containing protein [Neobacillus sp. OS1-33]WML26580.1 DUF4129 domain-containing protein [Neobacillus sp. OS1-33]
MVMVDTDKARDDLEKILKTKEYTVYHDSKGFIATWWDQAKEWVAAQLEKLFPAMDSASRASGPILISIIVVVIILFVISAFLLIRHSRRNRLLRKQNPLQSRKDMIWTYQRHLEEAEKHERNDEYTLSTRHLFLALLLYFHEKGWLEARIWKTNWDYYDELRKGNQQKADNFFKLARFFEEVTYGERKVHKDEYWQFHNEAIQVLSDKEEENRL